MSKETVAGIGRAIEEAQREKNLKEEQEAVKRKAEALRLEAERQALIAQNEARLRATGVVGLFEELRDSKVLTMSEAGNPAEIRWNSDNTEISIKFDIEEHFTPDPDHGGYMSTGFFPKSLDAEISEKTGKLIIGPHVMKRGEKLEDVVRNEILRLKGLRE